MKLAKDYHSNVFINCPFDDEYKPIFNAIVFAIYRCGFVPRCALEFGDADKIRINNILKLIQESKYSIHDLSRVELDDHNNLPRFNMPLELGICIGAAQFGDKYQKEKVYLILDSERFRFQKFISDLAGQDIRKHENTPEKAIIAVRDWLSRKIQSPISSGSYIVEDYHAFQSVLPQLCASNRWKPTELTFPEYSSLVSSYLIFLDKQSDART